MIEDDIDNRFLPRVWTDIGYYYPIFSELGVTYENADLEFNKENIKDVNWAFRWFFNFEDMFNYQNPFMQYNNELEWCTNKQDITGKFIWENDIVEDDSGNRGIVIYSSHFMEWRIRWYKGRDALCSNEYGIRMFDWIYPKSNLTIIDDIHSDEEAQFVKVIRK